MLALVWCDRNSWCFRTSNRNSEYLLQLTNPKTAQLIELPCGAYYIDKVDSIVSFFLFFLLFNRVCIENSTSFFYFRTTASSSRTTRRRTSIRVTRNRRRRRRCRRRRRRPPS